MKEGRKTEGIISWKEQLKGGRKKDGRYCQMERTGGKWRKEETRKVLDGKNS